MARVGRDFVLLSFLVLTVLVAGFLVIPGALLAACVRFRLLPALGLGAPLTVGILVVLAQIFAWIQVPWTKVSVGVTLVFLVALVCGLSWWSRAHRPRVAHAKKTESLPNLAGGKPDSTSAGTWLGDEIEMAPHETASPKTNASTKTSATTAPPPGTLPLKLFLPLTLAAFVLAGAVQLVPFLQTIPVAFAPAQSFDAMFHYSSIRVIADSGVAGWRGALDALYPGKTGVFYPNQWAMLLSLFLPQVSPTMISNAALLALTLSVCPLGVALLAEQVWGQRNAAIPLAVLLSPVPLVFPYFLGVLQALYPYVLAVMWWPAALWVVLQVGDVWAERRRAKTDKVMESAVSKSSATAAPNNLEVSAPGCSLQPAQVALLLLVLAATVHAHPATVGFIAIAAFMVLVNLVVKHLLSPWWWGIVTLSALGGGLVVPLGLQRLGVSARTALAGDNMAVWRSLGSMLGLSQVFADPWWLLLPFGLAMLAGLVWHAWLAREVRFLGVFATISLLVVAAKLPLGTLSTLTALWYGAYDRVGAGLAALLPVFAAGFVVRAAATAAKGLRKTAWRLGTAVLVGVVLVGFMSGGYLPRLIPDRRGLTQIAFVPGSQFHPPWVSVAEYQALSNLRLPPHSKLLGDPSSGAGLAYAAGGAPSFFLHLNPTGFSPDQKYLATHFREIHDNPRVCQILRREKITHYYVDATGVGDKEKFTYPGLHEVDTTSGFTEVARADQARLYRIDACR